MTRVIAYVDGFNLYFGLRSKHWRKYYWLDLPVLAQSLMQTGQQLVQTHYFTSRIRSNGSNSEDARRQSTYIDALVERGVQVHEGHYLKKTRRCRSCGATWPDYEEKMTDVNIATELLVDAFDDNFDTALVISGDSDLAPPVSRVCQRFSPKRVVIAFPPGRKSDQLKKAAGRSLHIGEDKLRQSQMPSEIETSRGHVLRRPPHWA